MNFSKMLDLAVNKFHIILGSVAQAALIVYHFKTGKDVGPGLMNTMYAYYAFLLGHAGVYQKWPDQGGGDSNNDSSSSSSDNKDSQTVNVTVQPTTTAPAPSAPAAGTGTSGVKG